MTNSLINFSEQNEKTAKAVAGTIGRFLKAKGLELPHTQALDLVGVLAGFADWRSLQAHLAAEEAKLAATPISMSMDEFKRKFKPVKNPTPNAETEDGELDGFAFSGRGADMDYIKKVLETEPGRVWTVVSSDSTSWLVSGYHYVNREFYVVTHVPATDPRAYEVPYGHDEDDQLFNVQAVVQETGEKLVDEDVYGSSPNDAFQFKSGEIDDVSEEARNQGQLVVVTVMPVAH